MTFRDKPNEPKLNYHLLLSTNKLKSLEKYHFASLLGRTKLWKRGNDLKESLHTQQVACETYNFLVG